MWRSCPAGLIKISIGDLLSPQVIPPWPIDEQTIQDRFNTGQLGCHLLP